jgi:hypothetical protein
MQPALVNAGVPGSIARLRGEPEVASVEQCAPALWRTGTAR